MPGPAPRPPASLPHNEGCRCPSRSVPLPTASAMLAKITAAPCRWLRGSASATLAAIERHEEAYTVFQMAPEGDASVWAASEYDAALDALLATPCATRFDASPCSVTCGS